MTSPPSVHSLGVGVLEVNIKEDSGFQKLVYKSGLSIKWPVQETLQTGYVRKWVVRKDDVRSPEWSPVQ